MDPVSQQPLPFIPTAGSLSQRLHATWLLALGWKKQKTKKKEKRNKEKRKCPYSAVSQTAASPHLQFHISHNKFSPHAVSRALRHPARSNHQTTLLPACTTEQPLTPSLPETGTVLPKKRGEKKTTPGPTKGRFRWGCLQSDAEQAVGYSVRKPKGCCSGGGEDDIWKLVPLNAARGYF